MTAPKPRPVVDVDVDILVMLARADHLAEAQQRILHPRPRVEATPLYDETVAALAVPDEPTPTWETFPGEPAPRWRRDELFALFLVIITVVVLVVGAVAWLA